MLRIHLPFEFNVYFRFLQKCVSFFMHIVFANLKRAKIGNVAYFERIVFDGCACAGVCVCGCM